MNGKGSRPRSNFSVTFRENYERVRWRPKNAKRRERRDWKQQEDTLTP